MSVWDEKGKKATLVVRKSFALKGSADAGDDSPSSGFRTTNNGASRHQQVSTPIRTSPVSEEDDRTSLTRFINWADEAIDGQKRDIDRISGIVERVETGMNTIKDQLAELRVLVATVPRSSRVEQMGRDVSYLQDSVDELQKDIQSRWSDGSANNGTVAGSGDGFFVEEVEVLTQSISRIGQKAHEVDDLKLELQFLKGRMKRLEDATRGSSQAARLHSSTPGLRSYRLMSTSAAGTETVKPRPPQHHNGTSNRLETEPYMPQSNRVQGFPATASEVPPTGNLSSDRPRKRGKFFHEQENHTSHTPDSQASKPDNHAVTTLANDRSDAQPPRSNAAPDPLFLSTEIITSVEEGLFQKPSGGSGDMAPPTPRDNSAGPASMPSVEGLGIIPSTRRAPLRSNRSIRDDTSDQTGRLSQRAQKESRGASLHLMLNRYHSRADPSEAIEASVREKRLLPSVEVDGEQVVGGGEHEDIKVEIAPAEEAVYN